LCDKYYCSCQLSWAGKVISCHVLHNHALYCSIKVLNLPIASGFIWEAGDMFDMEVIKQFLHLSVGELPLLSLWRTLGVYSLRNGPSTSSTFSVFWVIGKSQAYLEKQSMILTTYFLLLLLLAHLLISMRSTSSWSSLDRAMTGFCTLSHHMR